MGQDLPAFRYHPDPVATGSVAASLARCAVCGLARGYVYTGPVYGEEHDEEVFCPWCIADGSAADQFDVTFTETGEDVPNDVPPAVRLEISARTPGFTAWQQEQWLFHCGDGCAFLGRAGYDELRAYPDALRMLEHEHDDLGWAREETREYIKGLGADSDASAYLFRCLTCGTHLAYSDEL